MVGSTSTIKTMRLLRNKHQQQPAADAAQQQLQLQQQQKPKHDQTTTASVVHAVANNAPMTNNKNNNKRHNNSITSNTSSSSSASSGGSSTTTTSSSLMAPSLHQQQQHHRPHRYHHQRSASMRDHVLDLPAPEDDDIQSEPTPAIAYRQSPASVWVFPPLPPQPNLFCNNSQDALIQLEKAGLKGFRKQFSGRFKRFVLRKPAEPAPAIPPELKCQLKTIYVY